MNNEELNLQAEIHVAEVDRALALVGQIWESNEVLSVDQMCEHLEAVTNVITKTSTFSEFVAEAKLTGRERLN